MSSYIIKNHSELAAQLAELDTKVIQAKSAARSELDAELYKRRETLRTAKAAKADLSRVDSAAEFERRLDVIERQVREAHKVHSKSGLQVDTSQPAIVQTMSVTAAHELVGDVVSSAETASQNLITALREHGARMTLEADRAYRRLQFAKLTLTVILAALTVFVFSAGEGLWWCGLVLATLAPVVVEYFVSYRGKTHLRPRQVALFVGDSFRYYATATAGTALIGEVLVQGLFLNASASVSEVAPLMGHVAGMYLAVVAAASIVIASIRRTLKRARHLG